MTLKEFKGLCEARNPGHVNRSTDCCDWFYKDIEIFHERIHWGYPMVRDYELKNPALTNYSLIKASTSNLQNEYWANNIYTDLNLAVAESEKYGAIVQKSWYCDDKNPNWFLIFNDLNKVLEYSYDKILDNPNLKF